MAKIVEEIVVVKVSRLVKDDAVAEKKLTNDVAESLEAVVTELVGTGCVVEVVTDEG